MFEPHDSVTCGGKLIYGRYFRTIYILLLGPCNFLNYQRDPKILVARLLLGCIWRLPGGIRAGQD